MLIDLVVTLGLVALFNKPLAAFGDWFTKERGANNNGWL